jgi:hypothetical protein
MEEESSESPAPLGLIPSGDGGGIGMGWLGLKGEDAYGSFSSWALMPWCMIFSLATLNRWNSSGVQKSWLGEGA